MSKTNNLSDFLTDIADAIRVKKGTTNTINAQDFSNEISSIETNKPESSVTVTPSVTEQTITPENGSVFNEVLVKAIQTEEKTVTENGEVTPTEGKYLSKVTVDVNPSLQEKTVTPTELSQDVTPDSDFYGLSKITVNAIQTEEKTVTENGDVIPTEGKYLSKVTVDVINDLPLHLMVGRWRWEYPQSLNTIYVDLIFNLDGSCKYISSRDGEKSGTFTISGNTITMLIEKQDGVIFTEYIYYNETDGGFAPVKGVASTIFKCNSMLDQHNVQVIDYDGTIIKQCYLDSGATFTLPDEPMYNTETIRPGLIFQEWSSPVEIVDNTITVGDSDITIGAVYTTASGLSEFDITLTKKTGLSVTLNMDGTKDWGDGTSDTETSHTYSSYGDYTITCNGTNMTTSSTSGLFGQNGNSSDNENHYIRTIRLSSNITHIGVYAFQYCRSLQSITIPNTVTSMGNYAFKACYSLQSITIPSGITSVGYNVFEYCGILTSIAIPNTMTEINQQAFSECESLMSITIPSGVTSIGNYAFQYCYSLTSITIPNTVTSIGNYAFSFCYSLASITIPNTVTSIGNYAFQNCKPLKSISIPNGVTTIGSRAFNGCYSLASIAIPNTVTSILSYAFSGCLSLVYYDFTQATAVPTLADTNAFNRINQVCKIVVPDSLYDEWIAATNWSTYADYIYKQSEVA